MQIGLGIGAPFRLKWVPPLTEQIRSLLFGSGEQGALYDPSDLSTLFQDTAGTTPVTAVEQPVGRILDKSGRGNHATQATTTKRPVYSRRVNLLEKSEDLTDAYWIKNGVTALGNVLTETATTGEHEIQRNVSCGIGESFTFGVTASANERGWLLLIDDSGGGYAYFDLDNAVVGTGNSLAKASIVDDGTGKLKCVIEAASVDTLIRFRARIALGDVTNTSYAGDGVSSINIFNAFITTTSDAHLPYQRVNTDTDYDADPAKFPAYLRFDGVDDALQTGNIDFTGTDKMTVWAGVTKLSDAAAALLLESSANWNVANGVFLVAAPGYSGNFELGSKGTSEDVIYRTGFQAPINANLSMSANIGGPSLVSRVNGASSVVSTWSQGTGNYGNYPLYIGALAGTSLFFNGRIYSLIVRGAQSSLSQIEATELYIKRKMRLP